VLSQEEIRRQEYTASITRVIDCIDAHLDEPRSLESLAAEACFSRFHFHRVFAAMVGETLADYVRRASLQGALRAVGEPVAAQGHAAQRRSQRGSSEKQPV
jgi:AraC family transcriptional regulator